MTRPLILLQDLIADETEIASNMRFAEERLLRAGLRPHTVYSSQNAFALSSINRKGFDALLTRLRQVVANMPELLGGLVPTSWLALANAVRAQRSSKPVVDWKVWSDMAVLAQVPVDSLPTVTRFLHEAGEVLWFSSEPGLAKQVILEPKWCVDVFSSLITFKPNAVKRGFVREEDLNVVWAQYTFFDCFPPLPVQVQ
jgi:hypothetical protein